MRPVYPYDLQDAARALMAEEPDGRAQLARAILDRADIADRYRKRHQRPHPEFGAGSLSGAARGFPLAPMPWRCNDTFLACMRLFLSVYLDHSPHHHH